VIVTDNMFGDIITDLGAMIQRRHGHYHRQYQSEWRQHVRPIGGKRKVPAGVSSIRSPPFAPDKCCSFLGEEKAAKTIENAVIKITREKIKSLAAGKMGYTTSQVGDLAAGALNRRLFPSSSEIKRSAFSLNQKRSLRSTSSASQHTLHLGSHQRRSVTAGRKRNPISTG
jgi:hypothetical protein